MNKYNDFSKIIQSDTEKNNADEAYKISMIEFTSDSVFKILQEGSVEEKICAVINIEKIENKDFAALLLSHLTGHDGRIREAVSYVLSTLDTDSFFEDKTSIKTIIQGLLDINPNVARNILEFIKNSNIKNLLEPVLKQKTKEILSELEKVTDKDSPFYLNKSKSTKNHEKNKLTFNLYWLLSALSVINPKYDGILDEILTITSDFYDYTIREKTASILSKVKNPNPQLLQKLKNDVNIYVKNQILC